jgi:hypothetical protein
VRTVTLIGADTHVVMKARVFNPFQLAAVMKSQVFIPFAFFGVALVVAYIVG